MKKVLGVCGDSFMAATYSKFERQDITDSEGKHFTEILSKKINYDYFTLARGACSVTAIGLQVEEMIKRKVDFVIFSDTSAPRIEIPNFSVQSNTFVDIYSIDYTQYPDLSAKNFTENKKPRYISETINNMLDEQGKLRKDFYYRHCISENQTEAIRYYVGELLCQDLKNKQNAWIIEALVSQLKFHKIPYLYLNNCYTLNHSRLLSNSQNKRFCSKQECIPHQYHNDLRPDLGGPGRRWHTGDKAQEIIAEEVHNYILENNLLGWNSDE